jgi:hypothetical protein
MTGTKKVFVFQLVVAILAGLAFAGIYIATGDGYAANAGWGFLALLGLEKRIRGNDQVDERDKEIVNRASLVGYRIFWVCFGVGCFLAPVATPPYATIPAEALGFIPIGGYFLLTLARSIAGLALYSRGA